MSTSTRTPLNRVEPERLLHQHGEALLRRDFADQSAQDDQLRWWHNRALHSAYGIAEGLTVKGLIPGGQAKVSPGVAFDAFGRELILADRRFIDVPDTTDELLLVLSYHRPPFDCGQRVDGICQSGSFTDVDLRLRWVRRARFSLTDGVPIAVLNPGRECADPWTRPLARSQARPHIGHGLVTVRSEFDFTPWTVGEGPRPIQVGLQLAIDTSAAGFTGTPCYFVQAAIHPIESAPASWWFIASMAHVHAPDARQFTLRFLFPFHQFSVGIAGSVVARSRRREASPSELRISWIGVEHLHAAGGPDDDVSVKGGEDDELHS